MVADDDEIQNDDEYQDLKQLNFARLALSGVTEILDKTWLFFNLSKIARYSIYQHLKPIDFQSGQMIVREGEEASGLFIVVRGRIRVVQKSNRLDVIRDPIAGGNNNIIGEIGVLKKIPRTASVFAHDSKVETLFLALSSIQEIAEQLPEVDKHLQDLLTKSARKRVGPNGY